MTGTPASGLFKQHRRKFHNLHRSNLKQTKTSEKPHSTLNPRTVRTENSKSPVEHHQKTLSRCLAAVHPAASPAKPCAARPDVSLRRAACPFQPNLATLTQSAFRCTLVMAAASPSTRLEASVNPLHRPAASAHQNVTTRRPATRSIRTPASRSSPTTVEHIDMK